MIKTLDQFIITAVSSFKVFGDVYLILNDFDINIIMLFIFIIFVYYTIGLGIINMVSSIMIKIFSFIKNLTYDQLKYNGQYHYIYITSIFLFILLLNFIGMVPGGLCLTAQLIVTLTFSFAVFIGSIVFMINWFGFSYFIRLFIIESDVPKVMIPFLAIIEFVSFLSRVISLAVRLFANMVAGHSLLNILTISLLAGVKSIKKNDILFVILFVIPLSIVFSVYVLEFGIAFLQAYVFVTLSLIYLKDSHGKQH